MSELQAASKPDVVPTKLIPSTFAVDTSVLESVDVLNSAWFLSSRDQMAKTVQKAGEVAGRSATLTFLSDQGSQDAPPRYTVAMIAVDGLMVPLRLRLRLRWKDEADEPRLLTALKARLSEIFASITALEKRYESMRRVAGRFLQALGPEAHLRHLALEPCDIFERRPTLRQRPFVVEIVMPGDNLKPKPMKFTVSHPGHLTKARDSTVKVYKATVAAIEGRLANPGQIETDELTLRLLNMTNIKVSDIVDLPDGMGIPGPSSLWVGDAELTRVQFSMSAGKVSVDFDFGPGYFSSSSVYLHDTLPEILQQSLAGKCINEVVAGGIFGLVNPRIIGIGEMTAGTCIRLERLTRWVDLKHVEQSQPA